MRKRYPGILSQVIFRTKVVTTLTFFTLVIISCAPAAKESPAPPPLKVLKVSGAGGVSILVSAVKPAFEAATPGYVLEVLPGSGTGGGVKGILDGVLDVATMARAPKEDETAKNVAYFEFGQAGQAIITHPDVNVENLTVAQIQAIFSGEVRNWSEVGGANMPLILYVRDEDDSSTKALRAFIKNEEPFPQTVAKVFTSQGDMLAAVAGTPGSVGIANWPAALAEGAKVRGVKVDGLAPGDPAYPMVSPFGLGYLTSQKAQVQPFIDWLKSEPGRAALKEFEVILAP